MKKKTIDEGGTWEVCCLCAMMSQRDVLVLKQLITGLTVKHT